MSERIPLHDYGPDRVSVTWEGGFMPYVIRLRVGSITNMVEKHAWTLRGAIRKQERIAWRRIRDVTAARKIRFATESAAPDVDASA